MPDIPIEEIEDIASELAKEFCGKSLGEIRADFRELNRDTVEFKRTVKTLHDLFALAAKTRYERMGMEVKSGNARGRIREPGEDG